MIMMSENYNILVLSENMRNRMPRFGSPVNESIFDRYLM